MRLLEAKIQYKYVFKILKIKFKTYHPSQAIRSVIVELRYFQTCQLSKKITSQASFSRKLLVSHSQALIYKGGICRNLRNMEDVKRAPRMMVKRRLSKMAGVASLINNLCKLRQKKRENTHTHVHTHMHTHMHPKLRDYIGIF